MKTNYIFQIFTLLFFVFTANAQQGINYKAIINDDSGAPLANTSLTVQFTILESGTTNVFQETHSPSTDANGIIIVNIGEGSLISGDFNTIDWGSNPHFLKTEIDFGDGLTEMGTTEFTAVPYALYTKDAATKSYVDQLQFRIEQLEDFAAQLDSLIDNDSDGFTDAQGDCNDNNASVYPGANEICGDGVDQNCNGVVDDNCTINLIPIGQIDYCFCSMLPCSDFDVTIECLGGEFIFIDTPSVYLRKNNTTQQIELENVTFVSDNELIVTIPTVGLQGLELDATYDIVVVNTNNTSGVLFAAFKVCAVLPV